MQGRGACPGRGHRAPNGVRASGGWDPREYMAEADSDLPPFIYRLFKTMLLMRSILWVPHTAHACPRDTTGFDPGTM